jgi:hypothetical protein
VAVDDAELDDKVLLEDEGNDDVPPEAELLDDEEMVEVIVDEVAELRVIVEVLVSVELAIVDDTEEAPELSELDRLVADELNNEELGIVLPVLDTDDVLTLIIALDVLVPDEVVRLVDSVEDRRVLVEDEDELVESVLRELKVLEDTVKLVEADVCVMADVLKLLVVLELGVEKLLVALDVVVDIEDVETAGLVLDTDD